MKPSGRALVWFRRDLRLEDNPALAAATAAHTEVVCLVVIDEHILDAAGPHRRAQYLAHVAALDDELAAIGGRLRVRRGDPRRLLPAEAREVGADVVYWNEDVAPGARSRDKAVQADLTEAGVQVHASWGHLVHPPGAVRTAKGTLSQVFTPFFRRWDTTPWEPWPEPGTAPLAADAGEAGEPIPEAEAPAPMLGGPTAATARLAAFAERADDYLEVRDRIDIDATSGLSADLHFGTLSPRRVIEVVGTHSPGRAAFVRQLAWRDWYAHLLSDRPTMVRRAQKPAYDDIAWRDDPDGFTAWCEGRTGYPVVDAAMRQLRATGWMHNRARMIVASFLVKDLLVDWRRGEKWMRYWLTDGDVAQNVGNWQWVAGTGPDAAPWFRIFNPVTQSRTHAAEGTWIRTWVPELGGLAGRSLHEPWRGNPAGEGALPLGSGEAYPEPIVDHAASRERTLAAYRAATRAPQSH